jgi:hypothetical protein
MSIGPGARSNLAVPEVERETGVVVPGTKRHVEFVYRFAKPV